MKSRNRISRHTPAARRLRVEPLADRRMLAVLTVQNNLDDSLANLAGDGQLSLREAIEIANNPGTLIDGFVSNDLANEIRFDFGHDGPEIIQLEHGELLISSHLSLSGDGHELLTIDAGNGTDNMSMTLDGFRVLNIDDGDASHDLEVTVEGLTITGGDPAQTDLSGSGGGIRSRENVTLLGSVVTGNAAFFGGGIHHRYGTFHLAASTASLNSSFSSGGGITNGSGADYTLGQLSTLIVTQSTIHGNSISPGVGAGGGISSLGELRVENSTISGNVAGEDGGGIQLRQSQDAFAETTIVNSTISGNTTPREGGGIVSQAQVVAITHTTITDNSAGLGGGGIRAQFSSSPALRSTIVSGNWSDGLPDNLDGSLDTIRSEFNLLGSGDKIGGPGDIEDVDDPRLGPLADNGGPTKTHAFLPNSPAIDAGNISIVDPPQYDQRGNPFSRIADGNVPADVVIDIGAYEAQAPPSADFDSDGDVDGYDFLTWQRGYGKVNALRADGDSDNDQDVDQSDLAAWQLSYEEQASQPSLQLAPAITLSANTAEVIDALFGIQFVDELHGEQPAMVEPDQLAYFNQNETLMRQSTRSPASDNSTSIASERSRADAAEENTEHLEDEFWDLVWTD